MLTEDISMSHKDFVKSFFTLSALSLVASAAVSYLYNLLIHGAGFVDWQTSFRFSILFGLVLTWIRNSRGKKA